MYVYHGIYLMKPIRIATEVYFKAINKHPYLSVDYIIGIVHDAIATNDYTLNQKGELVISRNRRTNGKWVRVTFYVEETEDHYYVRVHVQSL